MSDQAIRAYLITQLQTIPGTGVIYDYSRYPALNETAAFLALFKNTDTDLIMGWELSRIGIPAIVRASNTDFKVTHTYQLEGYYSVQDAKASEKFFNTLVDAVLQKLIDIKIPNEQGLHLPKAPIIAYKMFGQVLCHYAHIEWPVSELVEKTAIAEADVLKLMLTAYLAENNAITDQAEIDN